MTTNLSKISKNGARTITVHLHYNTLCYSLSLSCRKLRLKLNRLFRLNVQLLLCAIATLPHFRNISLFFDSHARVVVPSFTCFALDHVCVIVVWHTTHTVYCHMYCVHTWSECYLRRQCCLFLLWKLRERHYVSFGKAFQQVSPHLCLDEHCSAWVLTPADFSGKGNGK